jgi:hypothetical protein
MNFGPMGSTDVIVQYGSGGRKFTAVNCTVLVPSASNAGGATQSLQCLSAMGVGADLWWTVTAGLQVSPLFALPGGVSGTSASRYLPPSVLAVAPSVALLSTRGRQSVNLTGSNFGPAGFERDGNLFVTYGPVSEEGRRYSARGCVVTTPHSVITCTTVSGVGGNHVWRVVTGDQESLPSTDTTSYVAPVVSSVSGQGTYQAKTDGGQVVTLSGLEFGSAADTLGKLVVQYGPAPFVSRFTARSCVVELDFSSITCLTAPGTGKGHSWIVVVDGTPSAVFAANSSYGPPVVATYAGTGTVLGSQECFAGSDCGSTRGLQTIVITGQNFGSAELGNALVVRYGPTGVELVASSCVIIEAHVKIQCLTVPGAGTRLKWSLLIGT